MNVILSAAKNLVSNGQMLRFSARHDNSSKHVWQSNSSDAALTSDNGIFFRAFRLDGKNCNEVPELVAFSS